jgi:hypothetical protein
MEIAQTEVEQLQSKVKQYKKLFVENMNDKRKLKKKLANMEDINNKFLFWHEFYFKI